MVFATKHILALGLVATVAGCGASGGSGGSTSGTTLGAVPKPSDYQSVLSDLTAATPSDTTQLTPQSSLPTSGQATYYGVSSLTLDGDIFTIYLGGTTMVVDFAKSTVTGEAKDFHKKSSTTTSLTSVTGSLDFIDIKLSGNNDAGIGSGITGSAEGTLDEKDVDVDVSGGFFGSKADNVSITYSDPVTKSGGVALLTK